MAANWLVTGLIVVGFVEVGSNEYVDAQTILLGVALGLQTHIGLALERRRRDPFIILLAVELIFYYSLRLFTLTIFPYSDVFDRYAYGPRDSNYALVFMLIANALVYAGLRMGGSQTDLAVDAAGWRPVAPARLPVLMLAAIAFGYFSSGYVTEDEIPRVFNFLALFLAPMIITFMVLAYFVLFRKALSRKLVVIIIVLLIGEMVLHTLVGSRSAIVGFLQNCMLVLLAARGVIRFRRATVLWCVALLPVIVALLVVVFTISTYNRINKETRAGVNLGEAARLVSESGSQLALGPALDFVLPPVFARAGFFDYSAELIAHRAQYDSIMNLASYGKSIVDNVLTPGFDVYDQPKISNALRFAYSGWGRPSKAAVVESYLSDQLGMYGEYYALFAYASLPLFFLVPFLLKRAYVRVRRGSPFALAMRRIVILFVFSEVLRSFGVDWIIVETLPLIGALFIYAYFFSSRRISAQTHAVVGLARTAPGLERGAAP